MPGKKDPRPQGWTARELRDKHGSSQPTSLPYKNDLLGKEFDSMGFRVHGHSKFMNSGADLYLQAECRSCRIAVGLPVGYLANTGLAQRQEEYTRKMARPPQDIHIKDVETSLHNLFCLDTYKIKSINGAGDLFDSHRRAARGLIDQLKMQGIKLVPDPDFEDKPKPCRHVSTFTIWDDPKKALKERVKIGYRCATCKHEAKFA